jgi:2-polyprenyl-6-methoxyphenol hydroxylase-like FAD-dependent oxidoreductase
VRRILAHAERAVPVHTVGDFAYRAKRFCGDGWVMVGDAAYFLDPIFSTGVHVALLSARAAAEGIDRGLSRGQVRATDFKDYDAVLGRIMGHYMPFIRGFYDAAFRDLLLNPRPLLGVERTVLRFLAGKVAVGWLERLQLRLFLWMVELRRRGRFDKLTPVPRLSAFTAGDMVCAPRG